MEKIQERALKFIYNENHSTYEELLAKSKLPSLKIRRIRTIAIETFKIINKETPQYLHDLVTLKNNKYNFRYSNTAHIPTVKTTRHGLNSFRYYASKTWNELPDHFRKETSFNQFKSLINSWNGSSCHCSFCGHDFKLFSYFFALFLLFLDIDACDFKSFDFYLSHFNHVFLFIHINI